MHRLTPALNDNAPACPACEGTGTETYYVGAYGTSACNGPAERRCRDCRGTGVCDHA